MTDQDDATRRARLFGRWRRVGPPASQAYPDQIAFDARGVYEAAGARGFEEIPLWDVGAYDVPTPTQVTISTRTDQVRTYDVEVEPDRLVFIDENGERIHYERLGD